MNQTIAILLVEDDPNDAFFIREALERTRSDIRLVTVGNGLGAVQYLSGRQPYMDRSVFPFPNLVLLDLRLPAMTGFQVMRWIRDQCQLRGLPVVILTDSLEEDDRQLA